MKLQYGLFIIAMLLFVNISSGQKDSNSVLDKLISIEIQNETIASILDKISSQAQVFFSYDASLIDSERIKEISVKNKTIRETLDLLFDSKFVYKVIDEQIIITKAASEEIKKKVDFPEEKPKLIIFKGKIIDLGEKDALPYTSILVDGTTIGTISNIDGEFELKIPESYGQDTVIFSCLGYRPYFQPISRISCDSCTIQLLPVSIRLKEIKVMPVDPQQIINNMLSKISLNYPSNPEIMTAFYREVLKQDNDYIDVAEALLEIRKSSYQNSYGQDKVKLIKGRKNLNVKPFQLVDFKIQGGPYYITKLDVIKTTDSFLDPEFRDFYKYSLDEIVELNNRDTYVLKFKPKEKIDYPCYQGKLYIDMDTYTLVQAEFSLSRSGLKFAHESLIKKKPKDFYVRPVDVDYKVSYRKFGQTWHLSNAVASINFKVKSKKDKINSNFHSLSELLITDFKTDEGIRYKRNELFNPKDIFTDMITTYDENFWNDYNIIKPSEELRNALRKYYQKNDSLFNLNNKEQIILNAK